MLNGEGVPASLPASAPEARENVVSGEDSSEEMAVE
jgi:hypothetical protein